MYFMLKSKVIFRKYDSFGYITDNRNFGYSQEIENGNDIGDKIVSLSGTLFLSALNTTPQTLDSLAEKISMQFTNVDIKTIKSDAKDFYSLLELDGFIVSGETFQECHMKDLRFSYKDVIPQMDKAECSSNQGFEKSTQEFFDEYFDNEPQLTNLHIEITSKCNERCVHCYIPHEYKENDMNPELFYNIIEQSRKMNLLHLTISGGEPMAHPCFIDFLKKCYEYNFSVNVLSNLTLLNDENIEEMKKNPLLGVQVSLYSMNADIHDSITQVKGSFEKTKKGILSLIKSNIPLQISCPILKQNIDSYNDVIAWGKEHNINVGSDYVIIARYNHTTQNLYSRLSIDDVKEIMMNKIAVEPHYLESIKKYAETKQNMCPEDFVCSVCHSSICVSDNGNIYPCAGWQDYVVGNVNEMSLNDIWHNSAKVKYLRSLRRRDFPQCLQCPAKGFCTMCMVRNANENPFGEPLVVNEYFCQTAKMKKEIAYVN